MASSSKSSCSAPLTPRAVAAWKASWTRASPGNGRGWAGVRQQARARRPGPARRCVRIRPAARRSSQPRLARVAWRVTAAARHRRIEAARSWRLVTCGDACRPDPSWRFSCRWRAVQASRARCRRATRQLMPGGPPELAVEDRLLRRTLRGDQQRRQLRLKTRCGAQRPLAGGQREDVSANGLANPQGPPRKCLSWRDISRPAFGGCDSSRPRCPGSSNFRPLSEARPTAARTQQGTCLANSP